MVVDDKMIFELIAIKEIREDDIYGGYCVNLKATFDNLWTNLMIDVTAGDVITYKEAEFDYKTLFDNETISILSYNYETILSKKYESIISRNVDNSRMKDYYDLYMFVSLKWNDVDKKVLNQAVKNTFEKRNTTNYLEDSIGNIQKIENDDHIRELWADYQEKYNYAKEIDFKDVITAIKTIAEIVAPVGV